VVERAQTTCIDGSIAISVEARETRVSLASWTRPSRDKNTHPGSVRVCQVCRGRGQRPVAHGSYVCTKFRLLAKNLEFRLEKATRACGPTNRVRVCRRMRFEHIPKPPKKKKKKKKKSCATVAEPICCHGSSGPPDRAEHHGRSPAMAHNQLMILKSLTCLSVLNPRRPQYVLYLCS
jgi:hypothetical protein